MDAEQRLREFSVNGDSDGAILVVTPEGRAACAAGADALALLRALPKWDHVGYCVFSKCEGHESFSDEPAVPHSETCPRHQITALLTRAGRA